MSGKLKRLSAGGPGPVKTDFTNENNILAGELLSRGYFVKTISRGKTVDYLIVSTAPPQSTAT